MLLERFAKLEQYILNHIPEESLRISCKQLNENAVNDGISTSKEKDIRTLLYFLTVKGYTRKKEDAVRNMEIRDRKSTRLNSSHANISYAVFCLKKKKIIII